MSKRPIGQDFLFFWALVCTRDTLITGEKYEIFTDSI